MRIRNVLLATGVAAAVATGVSAPAQATGVSAPAQATKVSPAYSWVYYGTYPTYSTCVDAGQQAQRDGWRYWKCPLNQAGTYTLFVSN